MKTKVLQDVFQEQVKARRGEDWLILDNALDTELGRRESNLIQLFDSLEDLTMKDSYVELVEFLFSGDEVFQFDSLLKEADPEVLLGKSSASDEQLTRVKNMVPLLPVLKKHKIPLRDIPIEFRAGRRDIQLLIKATSAENLIILGETLSWFAQSGLSPSRHESNSMVQVLGHEEALSSMKDSLRGRRPDIARFVEKNFSIPYKRPELKQEYRLSNSQEMRNELNRPWRKKWLDKHFPKADPEVLTKVALDSPQWYLDSYALVGMGPGAQSTLDEALVVYKRLYNSHASRSLT